MKASVCICSKASICRYGHNNPPGGYCAHGKIHEEIPGCDKGSCGEYYTNATCTKVDLTLDIALGLDYVESLTVPF
jgi:hypothetical protein